MTPSTNDQITAQITPRNNRPAIPSAPGVLPRRPPITSAAIAPTRIRNEKALFLFILRLREGLWEGCWCDGLKSPASVTAAAAGSLNTPCSTATFVGGAFSIVVFVRTSSTGPAAARASAAGTFGISDGPLLDEARVKRGSAPKSLRF